MECAVEQYSAGRSQAWVQLGVSAARGQCSLGSVQLGVSAVKRECS